MTSRWCAPSAPRVSRPWSASATTRPDARRGGRRRARLDAHGCARRLVPDRRDVRYELASMADEVGRRMDERLAACDQALQRALRIPALWLAREGAGARRRMPSVSKACGGCMRSRIGFRDRSGCSTSSIPNASPARGYAVVRRADGRSLATRRRCGRASVFVSGSATASAR